MYFDQIFLCNLLHNSVFIVLFFFICDKKKIKKYAMLLNQWDQKQSLK